MRLKLRVNNRETLTGAVRAEGVLIAIINFFTSEDGLQSGSASIHAYDFSQSAEWDAGEILVGDKIEIELLSGDEADTPTKTEKGSSPRPAFLFSNPDQARRALTAIHVCNEQLHEILRGAGVSEPHDEALNVQRAVAALVNDLGKYLIAPTLNRHPELLSEAKGLGLID